MRVTDRRCVRWKLVQLLGEMPLAKTVAASLTFVVVGQGVIDFLADRCAGSATSSAATQCSAKGASHSTEEGAGRACNQPKDCAGPRAAKGSSGTANGTGSRA